MAVQMAVLEKERTDKKCKKLQCKKSVTEVSSGWLKLSLAQYFERNKLFPGGNTAFDKFSVKLISFCETGCIASLTVYDQIACSKSCGPW